jgi:uncharacterized protein (TIGR03435 family)
VRLKAVFSLAICLCCACGLSVLWAQQDMSPSQDLAFEVATVRVNKSGVARASMRWQPGGRFVATNQPLRSLLSIAYAVPVYQLDSLPDWVATSRFDITAQATREPSTEERRVLLRRLLQDRFHVVSRTEVKERDIYALVVARADRRLGPGLRPSSAECPSAAQAAPPSPPTPGSRPKCSAILGIGSISGDGIELSNLTAFLGAQLERVVLDRTGLPGRFDIDLTSSIVRVENAGPRTATGADEQPTIFTAIQEQLGLKLESQRGPVPVTIFDRIEMPTED